MKRKAQEKSLRRKQLDKSLQKLSGLSVPRDGWIKEVCQALGMTTRQLAKRVGVSQPVLVRMEKGEVQGTISINSLKKIAKALDCDLVYALVPKESLDETVKRRAKKVAEKLVQEISHSMELEKQGISKDSKEDQVKELSDQLVREMNAVLWDDE